MKYKYNQCDRDKAIFRINYNINDYSVKILEEYPELKYKFVGIKLTIPQLLDFVINTTYKDITLDTDCIIVENNNTFISCHKFNSVYYFNLFENSLINTYNSAYFERKNTNIPKYTIKTFIMKNIDRLSNYYNNKIYRSKFIKHNTLYIYDIATDKKLYTIKIEENNMKEFKILLLKHDDNTASTNIIKINESSDELNEYITIVYMTKLINWAIGDKFYVKFDINNIPYIRFNKNIYYYNCMTDSLCYADSYAIEDNYFSSNPMYTSFDNEKHIKYDKIITKIFNCK